MLLLDGKTAFDHYKSAISDTVNQYTSLGYRPPHLTAVIAGNDGASETYVASKKRNSEALGMTSDIVRLPEDCTEEQLLNVVYELNMLDHVDGYIVQMPLPKQISANKVINAIQPHKDVDGFHPVNTGNMFKGLPALLPATPMGILMLLEFYHIDITGKHAVVIGRSDIVGKPMSALLARNANPGNATVTLCHSKTLDLQKYTKDADLLVVASGIPEMIKGDMVKPGATIIDVGISRVDAPNHPKGYEIKGDVDFESVAKVAGALSPVPGGVGLMTICGLMLNTLQAYEENYIKKHPEL